LAQTPRQRGRTMCLERSLRKQDTYTPTAKAHCAESHAGKRQSRLGRNLSCSTEWFAAMDQGQHPRVGPAAHSEGGAGVGLHHGPFSFAQAWTIPAAFLKSSRNVGAYFGWTLRGASRRSDGCFQGRINTAHGDKSVRTALYAQRFAMQKTAGRPPVEAASFRCMLSLLDPPTKGKRVAMGATGAPANALVSLCNRIVDPRGEDFDACSNSSSVEAAHALPRLGPRKPRF